MYDKISRISKYPKYNVCDLLHVLWENPAEVARQNSEKKGKSKNKLKLNFF
jgi:hypothetical protein